MRLPLVLRAELRLRRSSSSQPMEAKTRPERCSWIPSASTDHVRFQIGCVYCHVTMRAMSPNNMCKRKEFLDIGYRVLNTEWLFLILFTRLRKASDGVAAVNLQGGVNACTQHEEM